MRPAFYLDTHFKEWVHRYAFLSRFSFLIYGLSVSGRGSWRGMHRWRACLTLALGRSLWRRRLHY